jgi:DNA-binding GntR family transcriptional regulator
MDERDLRVRNHVYRRFVELGRALRLDELATELRLSEEETRAALNRLHEAHALVLERDRAGIRMLNPFSAIPTPHRVHGGGRWWFANCA